MENAAHCVSVLSEHSSPLVLLGDTSAADSAVAAVLDGATATSGQQPQLELADVAVESESASAMDFIDDLPQLSRLQQQQQAAPGADAVTAAVDGMSVELDMAAPPASDSGAADEHIQPQQQQSGQLRFKEASAATGQAAAASTASPPRPPAAPSTQQPPQSTTQAAAPSAAPAPASPTAATSPASAEPCAYTAPLFQHLSTYRTAQLARMAQYEADLCEFDRIAVAPWLAAALRHLRQQEDVKRDMTEQGQRMRQEIAEFVQKMQIWRGGLGQGRAARQQTP